MKNILRAVQEDVAKTVKTFDEFYGTSDENPIVVLHLPEDGDDPDFEPQIDDDPDWDRENQYWDEQAERSSW